jgi:hypothetical protein
LLPLLLLLLFRLDLRTRVKPGFSGSGFFGLEKSWFRAWVKNIGLKFGPLVFKCYNQAVFNTVFVIQRYREYGCQTTLTGLPKIFSDYIVTSTTNFYFNLKTTTEILLNHDKIKFSKQ